MSVENNIIDEWIKKDIKRDVAYRMMLWTVFAIIAYVFATLQEDFSPIKYWGKLFKLDMSILDILLPINLTLAGISLLFKDMEAMWERTWSQKKRLGKLGALLRKINTDLILWLGGLLHTLLIITVIFIANALANEGWPDNRTTANVLITIATLTFMDCFNMYLFILTKKEGVSIFIEVVQGKRKLLLFYILMLIIIIACFYFL